MTYELNERQQKFAEHFAINGKQADAYRFAYDAGNINAVIANERGRRQLRNKAVRDRIEELRGSALPPVQNVRDPRARRQPRPAGADANRETAEAIKALAAVAVSPAIPPGHRIASIELLHGMLSNLAAKLSPHPPQHPTGGSRGLSVSPNGGSMVGNGSANENSVGAGGRH